jgi:Tol biopolymer transport system component
MWRGADGALLEPASISLDGAQLAIVVRKGGKRTLTLLSSDGGNIRRVAETIDVSSAASWAPDGRTLAVAGSDKDGPGLFTLPLENGQPRRLTKGLSSNPVWSPDGSVIVYTGPIVGITGPLMAIRPDGTPVDLPPIQIRTGGERYRFVPGRQQLVYLSGPQASIPSFWLLDLTTKLSRQLSKVNNSSTRTFDITPDGREIVFDRLRDNSDIVLIDLPK